eukprot:TRINITY_DN4565_c1_g4_i1.p1 TRINITY_DN4565_c1_g4~~TRINITY_DN4565_c1_g4_i1.p1  ORF type:complete len:3113 (+),score=731.46 TRINITY_DN4565_c1_g4_i1:334-9339(+)
MSVIMDAGRGPSRERPGGHEAAEEAIQALLAMEENARASRLRSAASPAESVARRRSVVGQTPPPAAPGTDRRRSVMGQTPPPEQPRERPKGVSGAKRAAAAALPESPAGSPAFGISGRAARRDPRLVAAVSSAGPAAARSPAAGSPAAGSPAAHHAPERSPTPTQELSRKRTERVLVREPELFVGIRPSPPPRPPSLRRRPSRRRSVAGPSEAAAAVACGVCVCVCVAASEEELAEPEDVAVEVPLPSTFTLTIQRPSATPHREDDADTCGQPGQPTQRRSMRFDGDPGDPFRLLERAPVNLAARLNVRIPAFPALRGTYVLENADVVLQDAVWVRGGVKLLAVDGYWAMCSDTDREPPLCLLRTGRVLALQGFPPWAASAGAGGWCVATDGAAEPGDRARWVVDERVLVAADADAEPKLLTGGLTPPGRGSRMSFLRATPSSRTASLRTPSLRSPSLRVPSLRTPSLRTPEPSPRRRSRLPSSWCVKDAPKPVAAPSSVFSFAVSRRSTAVSPQSSPDQESPPPLHSPASPQSFGEEEAAPPPAISISGDDGGDLLKQLEQLVSEEDEKSEAEKTPKTAVLLDAGMAGNGSRNEPGGSPPARRASAVAPRIAVLLSPDFAGRIGMFQRRRSSVSRASAQSALPEAIVPEPVTPHQESASILSPGRKSRSIRLELGRQGSSMRKLVQASSVQSITSVNSSGALYSEIVSYVGSEGTESVGASPRRSWFQPPDDDPAPEPVIELTSPTHVPDPGRARERLLSDARSRDARSEVSVYDKQRIQFEAQKGLQKAIQEEEEREKRLQRQADMQNEVKRQIEEANQRLQERKQMTMKQWVRRYQCLGGGALGKLRSAMHTLKAGWIRNGLGTVPGPIRRLETPEAVVWQTHPDGAQMVLNHPQGSGAFGAEIDGATVLRVNDDSPAYHAGVMPGMVIKLVNFLPPIEDCTRQISDAFNAGTLRLGVHSRVPPRGKKRCRQCRELVPDTDEAECDCRQRHCDRSSSSHDSKKEGSEGSSGSFFEKLFGSPEEREVFADPATERREDAEEREEPGEKCATTDRSAELLLSSRAPVCELQELNQTLLATPGGGLFMGELAMQKTMNEQHSAVSIPADVTPDTRAEVAGTWTMQCGELVGTGEMIVLLNTDYLPPPLEHTAQRLCGLCNGLSSLRSQRGRMLNFPEVAAAVCGALTVSLGAVVFCKTLRDAQLLKKLREARRVSLASAKSPSLDRLSSAPSTPVPEEDVRWDPVLLRLRDDENRMPPTGRVLIAQSDPPSTVSSVRLMAETTACTSPASFPVQGVLRTYKRPGSWMAATAEGLWTGANMPGAFPFSIEAGATVTIEFPSVKFVGEMVLVFDEGDRPDTLAAIRDITACGPRGSVMVCVTRDAAAGERLADAEAFLARGRRRSLDDGAGRRKSTRRSSRSLLIAQGGQSERRGSRRLSKRGLTRSPSKRKTSIGSQGSAASPWTPSPSERGQLDDRKKAALCVRRALTAMIAAGEVYEPTLRALTCAVIEQTDAVSDSSGVTYWSPELVLELTKEDTEHGIQLVPWTAAVAGVQVRSAAGYAGVTPGMWVRAVDGYRVSADASRLLDEAPGTFRVSVQVNFSMLRGPVEMMVRLDGMESDPLYGMRLVGPRIIVVHQHGSANAVGLLPGMEIVEVGEERVSDTGVVAALYAAGQRPVNVTVSIPQEPMPPHPTPPVPFFDRPVTVTFPKDGELCLEGNVVSSVAPGTSAEWVGLRVGMRVIAVCGVRVTAQAASEALAEAPLLRTVTVLPAADSKKRCEIRFPMPRDPANGGTGLEFIGDVVRNVTTTCNLYGCGLRPGMRLCSVAGSPVDPFDVEGVLRPALDGDFSVTFDITGSPPPGLELTTTVWRGIGGDIGVSCVGNIVREVEIGSVAALRGIRPGCRVVRIEGCHVSAFTFPAAFDSAPDLIAVTVLVPSRQRPARKVTTTAEAARNDHAELCVSLRPHLHLRLSETGYVEQHSQDGPGDPPFANPREGMLVLGSTDKKLNVAKLSAAVAIRTTPTDVQVRVPVLAEPAEKVPLSMSASSFDVRVNGLIVDQVKIGTRADTAGLRPGMMLQDPPTMVHDGWWMLRVLVDAGRAPFLAERTSVELPMDVALTGNGLGLALQRDKVVRVEPEGAADLVGLRPGMRVLGVDGWRVQPDDVCTELQNACYQESIQILVELPSSSIERPAADSSSADIVGLALPKKHRSVSVISGIAVTSGTGAASGITEGMRVNTIKRNPRRSSQSIVLETKVDHEQVAKDWVELSLGVPKSKADPAALGVELEHTKGGRTFITKVEPDGEAHRLGLRPGMRITRLPSPPRSATATGSEVSTETGDGSREGDASGSGTTEHADAAGETFITVRVPMGQVRREVIAHVSRPPGGEPGFEVDQAGIVTWVAEGGAAEDAGLCVGMEVAAIDGARVGGEEVAGLIDSAVGDIRVVIAEPQPSITPTSERDIESLPPQANEDDAGAPAEEAEEEEEQEEEGEEEEEAAAGEQDEEAPISGSHEAAAKSRFELPALEVEPEPNPEEDAAPAQDASSLPEICSPRMLQTVSDYNATSGRPQGLLFSTVAGISDYAAVTPRSVARSAVRPFELPDAAESAASAAAAEPERADRESNAVADSERGSATPEAAEAAAGKKSRLQVEIRNMVVPETAEAEDAMAGVLGIFGEVVSIDRVDASDEDEALWKEATATSALKLPTSPPAVTRVVYKDLEAMRDAVHELHGRALVQGGPPVHLTVVSDGEASPRRRVRKQYRREWRRPRKEVAEQLKNWSSALGMDRRATRRGDDEGQERARAYRKMLLRSRRLQALLRQYANIVLDAISQRERPAPPPPPVQVKEKPPRLVHSILEPVRDFMPSQRRFVQNTTRLLQNRHRRRRRRSTGASTLPAIGAAQTCPAKAKEADPQKEGSPELPALNARAGTMGFLKTMEPVFNPASDRPDPRRSSFRAAGGDADWVFVLEQWPRRMGRGDRGYEHSACLDFEPQGDSKVPLHRVL